MTKKTVTKATKKTAVRRKTSAPKKTTMQKVENLNYADGKSHDDVKKAQDIEELLAVPKNNPFETMDFAKFEERLETMNISQMQEMAVSASIFPSGNRSGLKNKLSKEFKTRFGTKGSPRYKTSVEKPILDPESEVAREVRRILNS